MHAYIDSSRGFSFGEACYPAGGFYGPLRNRYLVLIIIHEGEARVVCDDHENVLRSRTCGFFRCEQSLLVEYSDRCKTTVSWCDAYYGELPEALTIRLGAVSTPISLSQRIETIQRLGVELGDGSGSHLNMLRSSLGETIFLAYFQEAQMSEDRRLMPSSVLRARTYMEENYGRDITIKKIATQMRVTPQNLVASFCKHVGMTPVRYLRQVRAQRGHFLLLQTGLTIADIAHQCGYKNQFHFSRQITELLGRSPREVRAEGGAQELQAKAKALTPDPSARRTF